MSEEFQDKLKQAFDIYELLTGKPDPEQEEQAQKDLIALFEELKSGMDSEDPNAAGVDDVREKLGQWDPTDKWFNEVKELRQAMERLFNDNNLIVQKTPQSASKPAQTKPATPLAVHSKLKPPEIKFPKITQPKRIITPTTNQPPDETEQNSEISEQPIEEPANSSVENIVPKIKINMKPTAPTPIKINQSPIKIKIPTNSPTTVSKPQIKPITQPQMKAVSPNAPKIKPVGAPQPPQIKPISPNAPKIKPVGAPQPPQIKPISPNAPKIKPVGAPQPPQIKPISPNAPKIKPVGAPQPPQIIPISPNAPKIKPVGAPQPPQIKPISPNAPKIKPVGAPQLPQIKPVSSNLPQIKPVGELQKPKIRAMGTPPPKIITPETPKATPNSADSKKSPPKKGSVNLFAQKVGDKKPVNLFDGKGKKSTQGGPEKIDSEEDVGGPLKKVSPLEKIDFQSQIAPVLSAEDEELLKLPRADLYYELLKLEAKRFYNDKLGNKVQENYSKGQITEAEMRGAKERHNFEVEQYVKKINKIREMITALK